MKPNHFVVVALVAVGLCSIVLLGCTTLPGRSVSAYDAAGLLRQGKVQEFNTLRQSHNAPMRFTFVDLDGAQLQGVNLSSTNWVLGKFRGANLANANFSGADVNLEFHGAIMQDVNFEGAELIGSNFSGADMTRANLRGANLENVVFTEAILEAADLRGARANGATFDHVSFLNADLRGVNFENASLRGTDFTGAKIEGANFDGADITDTKGLPSPPPVQPAEKKPVPGGISPGLKMY